MGQKYELSIDSKDFTKIKIIIDELPWEIGSDGSEGAYVYRFEHEDLTSNISLNVTLYGKVGTSAMLKLVRLENGTTWQSIVRVFQNDEANRQFTITQAHFKLTVSKILHSKALPKNFGDNLRNLTDFPGIKPTAINGNSIIYVYYVTDRAKVDRSEDLPFQDYSGARSNVKYGICEVNIPHKRKIGELTRPIWWKFQFKEHPDRHFMIFDGKELSDNQFFTALNNRLELSPENDVLVFIHGFNTKFDEAILRAAQISFDLGFSGAPIIYSWPSEGKLLNYSYDEESIIYSTSSMVQFLKDIRHRTGAKKIHLVGHSMGNRGLTAALAKLHDEEFFKDFAFNQIILAAPDIDAQVFLNELAPKMFGCSNRTTLYASSGDRALKFSRGIHRSILRLGESGDLITCCKGLDTIDASNTDPSYLGHGYFASTSPLINDIYQLINFNSSPNKRNLIGIQIGETKYWQFR
jgi:esterase/lipase superfamily enzyme